MTAPVEIHHDAGRRRFEATVEGHGCELDYVIEGRVMTITHTGVPAAVGGRGIAAALTQAAAQYARREGLFVRPACSYAAAWFRRHPAEADLLAL